MVSEGCSVRHLPKGRSQKNECPRFLHLTSLRLQKESFLVLQNWPTPKDENPNNVNPKAFGETQYLFQDIRLTLATRENYFLTTTTAAMT